MNAPIRRVAALCAVLFLLLLSSTTMVQFVRAKDINAEPGNRRTLLDNFSRERGMIVAGNETIARSVPSNDQYSFQRTYAQGPLYSQVTGFYGLSLGNPYGLEYATDDLLSGQSDKLFVRRLTDLVTGKKSKGATVTLTFDPRVQKAADEALGQNRGAVAAIDPKTGAILALVSHPQYDPNVLSSHDTKTAGAAYHAMTQDPGRPWLNRAIAGDLYPPGSTMKLVTATSAFDNGIVSDPNSVIPGPAELDLPLTTKKLPNEDGLDCGPGGQSTIQVALERSCNSSFGGLGLKIGADRLKQSAAKFGFGDSLTIPMRVTPSRMPADMNQPQTAQSAIGQYDVRVTPLQMAMVAGGIANKGAVMQPYLVQEVRSASLDLVEGPTKPTELSRATSDQTAAKVRQMMIGVVENGSGTRAAIPGATVAGKTGTAEFNQIPAGQPGHRPPHAWFVSFAEKDGEPKIAVAVIVENGGVDNSEAGGARLAAPVARAVMEAGLNR